MSTVYAAIDERLDRLVAVKVMSSALSADPNFSDRFAREARAAARLTHLNVVSVYDQGQESAPDGLHVFLVMELIEGRTLRALLRERGRLTPAEAVSIMEPVLSALAAALLAELADVRAELRLPVVPVPPRERPRGRTLRPEVLHRSADATTDTFRGRDMDSDTAVVPRGSVGVGQPLPLTPREG